MGCRCDGILDGHWKGKHYMDVTRVKSFWILSYCLYGIISCRQERGRVLIDPVGNVVCPCYISGELIDLMGKVSDTGFYLQQRF